MMQKNKSIRAKLKKKEYNRISTLVEAAQKNDPRLVRARNAEKKRRSDAKAARQEKKRLEEEKKRLEEEEALRKKEEEELKRKAAQKAERSKMAKVKKEIRKKKKIIRAQWTEAARRLDMSYNDVDIEAMFGGMNDLDQFKALAEQVKDVETVDAAKACLDALLVMFGTAQEKAREAVEKAQRAAAERKAKAERAEAERKARELANKCWHPTALSLLFKSSRQISWWLTQSLGRNRQFCQHVRLWICT